MDFRRNLKDCEFTGLSQDHSQNRDLALLALNIRFLIPKFSVITTRSFYIFFLSGLLWIVQPRSEFIPCFSHSHIRSIWGQFWGGDETAGALS
jgi:hypothetical protein